MNLLRRKPYAYLSYMNQGVHVLLIVILTIICLISCSNNPSEKNNSNEDVQVFSIPASDDMEIQIANITKSCRISLTGTINSETLRILGAALQHLYEKNSSIRIELDLSGTNGLEIMPHEGFGQCLSLESIIFPEGLLTIEVEPFDHCDNLKKIYIPSTVSTLRPFCGKGVIF